MINYTSDYQELRKIFDPGLKEIRIPGWSTSIVNISFVSDIDPGEFTWKDDSSISENREFSYPIFVPDGCSNQKALLLLHGLNERSWSKYLAWGLHLSRETGRRVILFPLSFHINRAPSEWTDPRKMQEQVLRRINSTTEKTLSSYANIALSTRLTEEPLRFFSSGYQTAFDIVKLMKQISTGDHGTIPAGSSVDIFAYSIGAFLSQVLIMGNPGNLFSDSRLYMFCGGSVFSQMQGTSKHIMDSVAYRRLNDYYRNDFEREITRDHPFSDFLKSTQIGMAFRSMIDSERFRSFRESLIIKLKDRIRSVALQKDRIIPPEGIMKTLSPVMKNKGSEIDVWDFPFDYSHENPFPLFSNNRSVDVDRSFERLIVDARLFFA